MAESGQIKKKERKDISAIHQWLNSLAILIALSMTTFTFFSSDKFQKDQIKLVSLSLLSSEALPLLIKDIDLDKPHELILGWDAVFYNPMDRPVSIKDCYVKMTSKQSGAFLGTCELYDPGPYLKHDWEQFNMPVTIEPKSPRRVILKVTPFMFSPYKPGGLITPTLLVETGSGASVFLEHRTMPLPMTGEEPDDFERRALDWY